MKTEHLTSREVARMIEKHGKIQVKDKEYSLVFSWEAKKNLAAKIMELVNKAYIDGSKNRSVNAI